MSNECLKDAGKQGMFEDAWLYEQKKGGKFGSQHVFMSAYYVATR